MSFTPIKQKVAFNGTQTIYRFPNGYGASVINHSFSHGIELAVIHFPNPKGDKFKLDYSTLITNDVIRHLTPGMLIKALQAIAQLPPKETSK